MLLGSSRTGEANDPETYISAVVRVLSAYPMDVVAHVVDPLDGVLSRVNWLPTPKEVRDACEEFHGPQRRMSAFEDRSKAQLEERAARERGMDEPRVDLKAKYGENYEIGRAHV